jgi:integrase
MPIRLVPPREGKSPNWTLRGTYLGTAVDRTAGTADKRLAARVLAKLKADIEGGLVPTTGAPTFASAATSYIQAGGSKRFLHPIALHFGTTPLAKVDQAAIDAAASELYPGASNATKNRQVYTPVSAILRHAGVAMVLRRPKGALGTPRTAWLTEKQMSALITASDAQGASFGALMRLLFNTGARLSEALTLHWRDVDLDKGHVRLRQTKESTERAALIQPHVIEALRPLKRGPDDKVFRLTKSGFLYDKLADAAKAAEVTIPERVAFHICRHTWATMMRRYAGADTAALVSTGAWKSRVAASVYEHLDATEDAARALMLPIPSAPAVESIEVAEGV